MPKHTVKKKSSWFITLLIIFFIIVALVSLLGFNYYRQWKLDLEPMISEPSDARVFVVEKGWSLTRIAQELEAAGLIRKAESFVTYGKLKKIDEKLQAGNYMLAPAMSVPEMAQELVLGRIITKTFTIPEGYHLRQIAKAFVDYQIATEEDFWRAVAEGDYQYDFLEGIAHDEKRLEGYLFPDTYIIPENMPIEEVLNFMLKRFSEIYNNLPENKTSFDIHQLVTLASIVENEAKLDEERPLVASVFINRLRDNWKLESCATIQYNFDEKKTRLYFSDLEIESAYNTYKYQGLPPGPICNPGKASLEAVVNPATTDYKFFVSKEDGSGGHIFSKTLSEHNQAKWLIRN